MWGYLLIHTTGHFNKGNKQQEWVYKINIIHLIKTTTDMLSEEILHPLLVTVSVSQYGAYPHGAQWLDQQVSTSTQGIS